MKSFYRKQEPDVPVFLRPIRQVDGRCFFTGVFEAVRQKLELTNKNVAPD